MIQEQEIEDDINMIKKFKNEIEEDEENDNQFTALLLNKINIFEEQIQLSNEIPKNNIFTGDENSRNIKKNKNKVNLLISLASLEINLKKKMTEDEIMSYNSAEKNVLQSKGVTKEDKDFLLLVTNQVSVAFNYQYDCTIKIFSSLSTLKVLS